MEVFYLTLMLIIVMFVCDFTVYIAAGRKIKEIEKLKKELIEYEKTNINR